MQINRQAFDSLREDVGDDTFAMVLDQFRRELELRGTRMAERVAAGDLTGMGEDAHSLKSTARTVGLDALADTAAQLEAAARAGEAARGVELARQLVTLCRQGLEVIDRESARP